jgi:hypothetical protein
MDINALTEPFAIAETFISDIADAEELAPNLYRVRFVSKQRGFDGPEYQVVAKFIMTQETMIAVSRMLAEVMHISPALLHMEPNAVAN